MYAVLCGTMCFARARAYALLVRANSYPYRKEIYALLAPICVMIASVTAYSGFRTHSDTT